MISSRKLRVAFTFRESFSSAKTFPGRAVTSVAFSINDENAAFNSPDLFQKR